MSYALYKTFFDYVDSTNNKNGKISKAEMIKACAPDINNNGTMEDNEFRIGTNNAEEWISRLPLTVMDDDEITFDEYLSYVSV